MTYPTAYVDLTRVGMSNNFIAAIDYELIGTFTTGDLVYLTDGDVEPRLFRITEIFDDGRTARYVAEAP